MMTITAVAKCDETHLALQGALFMQVFVDFRFPKEVFALLWGSLHGDHGACPQVHSFVHFPHAASASPFLQDIWMAWQRCNACPQHRLTFQEESALTARHKADC